MRATTEAARKAGLGRPRGGATAPVHLDLPAPAAHSRARVDPAVDSLGAARSLACAGRDRRAGYPPAHRLSRGRCRPNDRARPVTTRQCFARWPVSSRSRICTCRVLCCRMDRSRGGSASSSSPRPRTSTRSQGTSRRSRSPAHTLSVERIALAAADGGRADRSARVWTIDGDECKLRALVATWYSKVKS